MADQELEKEMLQFFAEIDKEYNIPKRGPDEFTRKMLAQELEISERRARTILDQMLVEGKVTHRLGITEDGKIANLYRKVVKK